MQAFLDASLAFPTAFWSILLVVVLIYWAFVIIGAVDIDILEVDGALDGVADGIDGALDGAADGIDGALDGAADGIDSALDGGLDGAADAADGAADGAAEGGGGLLGGFVSLLSALGLRKAPITVVLSFLVLFAWILSYMGMRFLVPILPYMIAALIVGVGALILAVPLTSLAVRPMGSVFETATARSRHEIVGNVCVITTGRVDDRFGQADCVVGTDHLLIQVRYRGSASVTRGQEALIVSFDRAEEAYVIEPMDQD